MKVSEIIEAIDDPSGLIHPEKHQAFARGSHPLGKNPAYPKQPGVNYEEVLASRQWQKILEKAQKYLGVPLTQQALPLIAKKTMQAMALIDQAESQNREQLQDLAIKAVFMLPEFQSARKSHEQGRFLIDARLVDEIDATGMRFSEAVERTPAEEEWMKKTVQRRYFTNAMIQGSAVSNDFLFELVRQELDAIHPGLRNAYGTLMIGTEIGYWMFPQNDILAAAKKQTKVGAVRLAVESLEEAEPGRKRPVIVAQGMCFPVLIQEIIKGLTELASLPSLPRDPKERQEVIDQTDMVDLETWSMILGPKLWDSFIEAIDAESDRELAFHLYSHIQRMDVDKFNSFMAEVLAKSPRGMQMLRNLASTVKAELADDEMQESTEAQEIVAHLLESEDEFVDWKDVTGPAPEEILDALNSLNSNYGRGDIESVDFDNKIAHVKKQYGTENVRFDIQGNTLLFRGHRVTLKP